MLIPTAYAKSKGLPYTRTFKYPTRWCSDSVVKILEKSEYIGHTVNFRTRQKSRKNKKKIKNSRVEWVIFENSSHMPHLEETEKFLQVLDEFLNRVEHNRGYS